MARLHLEVFASCLGVLLLLSLPAAAQPVVHIEWEVLTGDGPPIGLIDVVAQAGDKLRVHVFLENGGGSILGYTIGLHYDSAALSLDAAAETVPSFWADILDPTSNGGLCPAGDLLCEAHILGGPPVSGEFEIGTAEFTVLGTSPTAVTTGPCSGPGNLAEAIYDGTRADVTSSPPTAV